MDLERHRNISGHLIVTILAWSAALLALNRGAPAAEPGVPASSPRPNVIFILVDDMGWSDIGCYGGEIATPNLDRLGTGGMRFTQFHNTSKCFPSRACLITGTYAQQCGMDRGPAKIVNAVTFGEVMRSAGYRTLMVGKHHGAENMFDRGFDHYSGLRGGASNHFNPGGTTATGSANKSPQTYCFDDKVISPYIPEDKNFYTTDNYTQWACDMLDRHTTKNQPFFMYLAYTAPHDPLQAWPDDIAKYRGKYKAGYQAIRDARYQRQREMGLIDDSFPKSDPTHKDWESLSEEQKDDQDLRMAIYAAMIDRLDQQIGNLLKKLKERGQDQNTVIFFASDNGCSAEVVKIGETPLGTEGRWSSLGGDWANVSNVPFRLHKNSSFEGGICTPFIAYWPGRIKAGGVSNRPGHFIDVMPTLVELSGASYPAEFNGQTIVPMQGESLVPTLLGQDQPRKKPIFWQWQDGRAVMHGKWKLVTARGDDWSLFDLEKDKSETTDVAKQNPGVVAELEAMWNDWYSSATGNEWAGKPAKKKADAGKK